MDDKKIVSVSLGGQQVTIEVPVIEANRSVTTRQGGLLYSRNFHFWYAGGTESIAARIGALPLSVLMYLTYRADWQSLEVEAGKWEIAEGISLCKRTVDQAIQTLIGEKVIVQFDNATPAGRGDKNFYKILTPVVRKKDVQDAPIFPKGVSDASFPEPKGCIPCIERVQEKTEKGAPDAPPLKGITRLRDLTTTDSSSSELKTQKEIKRIVDLFYASVEQIPNRALVSEAEAGDWASAILSEYRLEEILRAIERSDWAEHPKGVEKTLRSRFRTRKQIQAAAERRQQREKAKKAQEQIQRENAVPPAIGLRINPPAFIREVLGIKP